jgi:hypothetical protein
MTCMSHVRINPHGYGSSGDLKIRQLPTLQSGEAGHAAFALYTGDFVRHSIREMPEPAENAAWPAGYPPVG